MTKHVKSTGLFICRWFAAAALGCFSLTAYSQAEIPFNGKQNSIEYKAAGNTYTWQPVTGDTPRPAQPYRPDLSGGTVSTVEPRAKWSPALPYDHKGGAGVKMNFSAVASKAAVAGAAAKQFAKGAVACGARPGNPLVVSAQIAGCMGGMMLVDAAIDWGWHQLNVDEGGLISASFPASDYEISRGYTYSVVDGIIGTIGPFNSSTFLCSRVADAVFQSGRWSSFTSGTGSFSSGSCVIYNQYWQSITFAVRQTPGSSCESGYFVTPDNQCFAVEPKITKPLEEIINKKIVEEPWGVTSAQIMAGVMMAGHNVFTDGTSGTITGPNTVPLGTSIQSWPVNVLPGTATVAPPGHSGPTDSGTQTSTTTKTATNTYAGNQQTTGTGSTTSTTVTNNVTNNTTTNVTNTTQTDEKPKDEEKDFCQNNPDSLACAETDTPEQETPTGQLNIGYEYVDIFGNGSCPSDSYLNTHGQSLKVWDWAATCDNVQSYFRPILIACCAFAAFVIVSAGAKE